MGVDAPGVLGLELALHGDERPREKNMSSSMMAQSATGNAAVHSLAANSGHRLGSF